MNPVIEIGFTATDIEKRRQRAQNAKRIETPDRIPVIPAIAHRFLIIVPSTVTTPIVYFFPAYAIWSGILSHHPPNI